MRVIKNEKIKDRFFLLTIFDPYIAKTAKPGQFVNIRIGKSFFPLLRRPLSVHSVEGENFKVLYKVVGEGTKILSTYKPNSEIDIIGPLGNSFSTKGYKNLLIIGGGIGIAPLYFLAEKEREKELTILIGAKNKAEILCVSQLSKFGKVMVTTEDGSYGKKGVVTDLLNLIQPPEIIFSCGPPLMLRVVQSYASAHSIPCQISLEQHLACGLGMCLGCAVPLKQKRGYKYICKDGPVFWAEEVET